MRALTRYGAADIGIGRDAAELLAHLTGHGHGIGADGARFGAIGGTGVAAGSDDAGLLAHLSGTGTGTGVDGAAWMEKWRATGTSHGIGRDAAALLAHLAGRPVSGRSADVAALLSHLSGKPTAGRGAGSGTATFSAHDDAITELSTPGDWTYQIPPWATVLDLVGLGAGGGGRGGGLILAGSSGERGNWNSVSIFRGTSIPWSQSTLTGLHVGAGGAGGAGGIAPSNGAAGGETWIVGYLSAPGGRGGGNGTSYTRDPGHYVIGGVDYAPTGGWGGAGGGTNKRGDNGDNGRIFIRALQL